jgi:hypothetical protein
MWAATRAFAVGRLLPDSKHHHLRESVHYPAIRRSNMMLIATNEAFSKDVGLLATFLGIGLIVNVIVVFIAVLIRGERQQNQQQQQRR